MFRAALGLLIIAMLAAFLGFGGIAGIAAQGAELFFVGGLIVLFLALLFGRRLL